MKMIRSRLLVESQKLREELQQKLLQKIPELRGEVQEKVEKVVTERSKS